MLYYFIKVILSAVIIVVVSEVAKRSSLFGALIASLPLTSLLALIWLYLDTKDLQKVSALSYGIFWIVIPSLIFFICFPFFIKSGWNFWMSLIASIGVTGGSYWTYMNLLSRFGIEI